ncbi:hypothetical protein J2752_001174 [Halarchaeum rubridurum]|uniref:Uncharacterized protein n=1 Tax=Halarchaeum rubridurum TaxID=489911 RepID=A0A830FPT5_9EURY|nr:hypothetical protein [Halarchaeum rubridurum]MBP1954293.1 hypothetical protein [Halarchaeum rubridurum]GGM58889.1 hypothetical protein GCM10009017_06270 [Halarchaeum rubridurum]
MATDPDTGGEPEHVGECEECGRVYPVQVDNDGDLRPIGTSGTCVCGSAAFVALSPD